jgi:hypothetical protein
MDPSGLTPAEDDVRRVSVDEIEVISTLGQAHAVRSSEAAQGSDF